MVAGGVSVPGLRIKPDLPPDLLFSFAIEKLKTRQAADVTL